MALPTLLMGLMFAKCLARNLERFLRVLFVIPNIPRAQTDRAYSV